MLELLFHVIANPGDAVLVPTPSYAGFWPDLETRDELCIVPVHTSASTGFRLTPELLDSALKSAGRRVRALLFTSPDNPLGRVYSRPELEAVLSWAEHAGIHLVMDKKSMPCRCSGPRPSVGVASLRPALRRAHAP